jgi:hypothetical protein
LAPVARSIVFQIEKDTDDEEFKNILGKIVVEAIAWLIEKIKLIEAFVNMGGERGRGRCERKERIGG